MTSRRVRGPVEHRAAGGEPPLASRGLQNSQRVLLAKPRTAPLARRRDGDIAPYRNGTAPRGTRGAHDAMPRTAVASSHGQCARVIRVRIWQVAHAESFAGGVSVRLL